MKLTADYTRLKTKYEKTEEEIARIRENEEKQDIRYTAKFTELYDSRNKTNETLTELTTTLKIFMENVSTQYSSMRDQFLKLEQKIDSIKKE